MGLTDTREQNVRIYTIKIKGVSTSRYSLFFTIRKACGILT